MRAPLPQQPLTVGRVRELAATPHLDAAPLKWLIWLPFLNATELARCLGWVAQTAYKHLQDLQAADLVEAVSFLEPEQGRQQRYYVTDAGLYVYALRFTPAPDVAGLVRSHPVREAALLGRLARPAALIRLSDLSSRLVADGRALGFQLVGWKQPWQHYYAGRTGRRKRLSADAVFDVSSKQGHSGQFCLLLDTGEQRPPGYRKERALLRSLLDARDAQFWRGGDIPFPLLVTEPHRLASWGRLLAEICEQRSISVPPGALTTFDRLSQGCFAPIWWTFREVAGEVVADWGQGLAVGVPPHSLEQFCVKGEGDCAPPAGEASETRVGTLPGRRRNLARLPAERTLKRYVRGGFVAEALRLRPGDLLLHETPSPSELVRLVALLNLRLSDAEKAILTWLAQHTLLSLPDLAGLVAGGQLSLRSLQRRATHLLALNLLGVRVWDEGPSTYARVRYHPWELALRYCALREGLPATHYLTRDPKYPGHPTRDHPSSWVQRGLDGLWAQMRHTAGVYRCMVEVICATRERGCTEILAWKSAREAVRPFVHSHEGTRVQVRPDGEVLYREPPGRGELRTILLEYDRGTVKGKDYRKKFNAYHAYGEATGAALPLVLFVTQRRQSVRLIRQALKEIDDRLPVQILLESDLLAAGLVLRDGRIDLAPPD